jgi:hypothetical protein
MGLTDPYAQNMARPVCLGVLTKPQSLLEERAADSGCRCKSVVSAKDDSIGL